MMMKYIEEFKDDLVGNSTLMIAMKIFLQDIYNLKMISIFLVQLIHPMGFKDGEVLILKERINKIQKNTQYLKEIEILMKENSKENILKSYIFNKKK